jgi:hypothetical protein
MYIISWGTNTFCTRVEIFGETSYRDFVATIQGDTGSNSNKVATRCVSYETINYYKMILRFQMLSNDAKSGSYKM